MTELAALRDAYRTDKAALLAQLGQAALRSVGVSRTLAKLTRLTDALLTQLWQRAALDASGGCLMAVGGYGRGELLPHSDVDVLVLLPDTTQLDQDTALQAKLEAFIGSCWDVGLEIGSSVRTLSQCLAESDKDITVQTALLESRRITGQAQLAKTFAQAYTQAMDAQAFFTAKTLELRQRHTKYEDTPYALEPNCKESPGGLRDLQIILWVAKAAGLGHTWDDLVQSGIATALEATQLRRNEALLTCIRARLHLVARRREDRLVFDLQTAVAESFGMQLETTPEGRLKLRASEKLMREYYWAAKAVMQLNQILLQGIEDHLKRQRGEGLNSFRPINERFFEKDGLLEVANDELYERNPHAILETFLLYQATPGVKGFSASTLRALYNARHIMDAAFRRDPVNRATFVQILQQPQGITHAMRLMNQTSVLGATFGCSGASSGRCSTTCSMPTR